MKKKHILIEIIPRVLWLMEFFTLFVTYSILTYDIKLTENLYALLFGILFVIIGGYYSAFTFKILAKAMISKDLVQKSIYKYIRHPMYVALYLLLIGIGMLFFSLYWYLVLIAFCPLWYITGKLEELQMQEIHGEKYMQYKAETGMFFPKLK